MVPMEFHTREERDKTTPLVHQLAMAEKGDEDGDGTGLLPARLPTCSSTPGICTSNQDSKDDNRTNTIHENTREPSQPNDDHMSAPHRLKPNKELTVAERRERKELKKRFKRQRKSKMLHSRLRQSVLRGDSTGENEARRALQDCGGETALNGPSPSLISAHRFITEFAKELTEKGLYANGTKQTQKDQAASLLRHMTKGTQQSHMFEDPNTLWGYTRQKFHTRARLVVSSFENLNSDSTVQISAAGVSQNELELRNEVWESLFSVRELFSFGCGPGCDALGFVAFLNGHERPSQSGLKVQSVHLFDWAIEHWSAVLHPFVAQLGSGCLNSALIQLGSCDLRHNLQHAANIDVIGHLEHKSIGIELYLFSYILTELRGKWIGFVKDLVKQATKNSLFYFAEPAPWQLHFLQTTIVELEYIWLDSSMNEPALRALDRRTGPAVILGRKR